MTDKPTEADLNALDVTDAEAAEINSIAQPLVPDAAPDADDDLVQRWSDQPEWAQMMLRATMFRLAVHALHPRSTAGALPGLARVVDIVRMML